MNDNMTDVHVCKMKAEYKGEEGNVFSFERRKIFTRRNAADMIRMHLIILQCKYYTLKSIIIVEIIIAIIIIVVPPWKQVEMLSG